MTFTLEVCAQGIESALAAEAGGADRIELCEDRAIGGVTPSAGMIATACRKITIPVHVLIRPRGGDFNYSAAEFDVMLHDVMTAKSLGAAGVVVGCLRPDRSIDLPRLTQLLALARPLEVTFHRAFDEVRDPHETLESLIELGIERVLTSGGSDRAFEGSKVLAALAERAGPRLTIMAGGRILGSEIPTFLRLGLKDIHVGSAASSVDGRIIAAQVRRLRERQPGDSDTTSPLL